MLILQIAAGVALGLFVYSRLLKRSPDAAPPEGATPAEELESPHDEGGRLAEGLFTILDAHMEAFRVQFVAAFAKEIAPEPGDDDEVIIARALELHATFESCIDDRAEQFVRESIDGWGARLSHAQPGVLAAYERAVRTRVDQNATAAKIHGYLALAAVTDPACERKGVPRMFGPA